jgi:hypothetical protein
MRIRIRVSPTMADMIQFEIDAGAVRGIPGRVQHLPPLRATARLFRDPGLRLPPKAVPG